MKKIICCVLSVCMIFGMLPLLAFSGVAASATPLKVTPLSMSENYHQNLTSNAPVNWALGWNANNTTRAVGQIDEDFYMIGKFDQPTRVTNFVLCISYYGARCEGMNVSLSTNGSDWVDVATVMNQIFNETNGKIQISTPAAGDTKYEYVKVWRDVEYHNGSIVTMWVDFMWIAFYDDSTLYDRDFIDVSHVSSSANAVAGIENAWDFSNATTYRVAGAATGEMMRGKLKYPTVLSDIYIKKESGSAHYNHTAIEASVDGVTWIEIAKITANTMYLGNVMHLPVSDTTPYNYVRVIRNQAYSYWYAIGIGFFGTEHPEAVEHVEVKGFQRSVDADNAYALRFICSVDSTEYSDIGMKIACHAEDGGEWNFDVKASEFRQSFTEKRDGTSSEITAQELGGVAICTAVIDGIPSDIGFFSAQVTPYYTVDGVKKEGHTQMVIMKNSDVAQNTNFELSEQKNNIKVYGRSAEIDEGIACDFTASGIEFNARLAGDVYLTVNCSALSYYTLYLDGVRQDNRLTFNGGTAEYLIAKGLPAKEYNVRLVKQTHVVHSISSLVSLRMYGEFTEKPQNDALMIEFIGDSITCGYGTVGYPESGVSSYSGPKYCDATKAYAFKTAELLEADYSMVSVSGWAVRPDGSGGGCIPNIYGKESFQRSDKLYVPNRKTDIIVIHLGTNDINSRANYETDFVNAAKGFIEDVRAVNSDAKIIWIYGSMLTEDRVTGFEEKIQTIVRECGGSDAGIWSLRVPYNQSAGNGHPSDAGHTETAQVLAKFIQDNGLDR